MSTQAQALPADEPAVSTKPFTMTRGGAYLLEGLLQKTQPFTKVRDQRRANRLWAKLHRANPAKMHVGSPAEINFEKPYIRTPGSTEIEWAHRQSEFSNSFTSWKDEQVTLQLTKKDEELLVDVALKWALKNRKDCWPENNEHTLSVFEAFPDVFEDEDA